MAIKQWEENGKTHYQIDVCAYSKKDSENRKQKRESGSIDETEPAAIAKKLKKIEDRLMAEAQRVVFEREVAGISWGDLVKKWEKSLRDEVSEANDPSQGESLLKRRGQRTIEGYLQAVRDFTEQWNKTPASQITPADVEDLFRRMAHMGYSNSRQYNVKVAISQCFTFGIKRRFLQGVTVSPTYGFGISRKESKRPEILNAEQVDILLTEARRRNHPWRTIWEGVYHLGLRSGEAQELRAKDVSLSERMVYLERQYIVGLKTPQDLKDDEWRQLPINDDLYELFMELGVQNMAPEDHVFPRITAWKHGETARHLRAFCEEIKIPSICFHTLRACWATQLLKNGVNRLTVQVMGGWSDQDTMDRYIRLSGLEVKGATESLARRRERPGRVALRVVGG